MIIQCLLVHIVRVAYIFFLSESDFWKINRVGGHIHTQALWHMH